MVCPDFIYEEMETPERSKVVLPSSYWEKNSNSCVSSAK
jgi:hypothetical protein